MCRVDGLAALLGKRGKKHRPVLMAQASSLTLGDWSVVVSGVTWSDGYLVPSPRLLGGKKASQTELDNFAYLCSFLPASVSVPAFEDCPSIHFRDPALYLGLVKRLGRIGQVRVGMADLGALVAAGVLSRARGLVLEHVDGEHGIDWSCFAALSHLFVTIDHFDALPVAGYVQGLELSPPGSVKPPRVVEVASTSLRTRQVAADARPARPTALVMLAPRAATGWR